MNIVEKITKLRVKEFTNKDGMSDNIVSSKMDLVNQYIIAIDWSHCNLNVNVHSISYNKFVRVGIDTKSLLFISL